MPTCLPVGFLRLLRLALHFPRFSCLRSLRITAACGKIIGTSADLPPECLHLRQKEDNNSQQYQEGGQRMADLPHNPIFFVPCSAPTPGVRCRRVERGATLYSALPFGG